MNRASFALAMCAAVGPVTGQGDEAPQLVDSAVETVFHLSANRLQATNPSSSPRLLLFSDAYGVLASAILPAGGELDAELVPAVREGVTLETYVLGAGGAGTVAAGVRFSLSLPAGAAGLWVEERTDGVDAWLATPGGKQAVQALGSHATPFGPTPTILESTAAPKMPLHVPVNTPDGTPPKDEPPVLDDEPLPPV